MWLHEAEPHGERPVFIDFHELLRLLELIERAHVLFKAGVGKFFRIEPDTGGIFEGMPGRFGRHAFGNGARLDGSVPIASDFAFSRGDIKAMQAGLTGHVEMHFAKHGGGVTGLLQLARQGGFILGERRRKTRDTGHVRHLPGKKTLARGRADRGIAVVGGEAGALRGEAVEIGCVEESVAITAEDITSVIVSQNIEQVRASAGGGQRQGLGGGCSHQQFTPGEMRGAQKDTCNDI